MEGIMWNADIFFCFLTPGEYILVLQLYVIRAGLFDHAIKLVFVSSDSHHQGTV
jgi:hypothetical protein